MGIYNTQAGFKLWQSLSIPKGRTHGWHSVCVLHSHALACNLCTGLGFTSEAWHTFTPWSQASTLGPCAPGTLGMCPFVPYHRGSTLPLPQAGNLSLSLTFNLPHGHSLVHIEQWHTSTPCSQDSALGPGPLCPGTSCQPATWPRLSTWSLPTALHTLCPGTPLHPDHRLQKRHLAIGPDTDMWHNSTHWPMMHL